MMVIVIPDTRLLKILTNIGTKILLVIIVITVNFNAFPSFVALRNRRNLGQQAAG